MDTHINLAEASAVLREPRAETSAEPSVEPRAGTSAELRTEPRAEPRAESTVEEQQNHMDKGKNR